MRTWVWVFAWAYGVQAVLHHTNTPGNALIGLVLLSGVYSLVLLFSTMFIDER